jgi:hypothetical protein
VKTLNREVAVLDIDLFSVEDEEVGFPIAVDTLD